MNLDTVGMIGGNSLDNSFNETSLMVLKCVNSTENPVICKSQPTMDNLLSSLRAQFIYLNTNFQGDNTNPLQGYLDTGLVEGFNPLSMKLHAINLAQNQAYRVDSWYSSSVNSTDPLNFFYS